MKFYDQRIRPSLWDRVQPEPLTGCWIWIGSTTKNGYGVVTAMKSDTKSSMAAHRWFYLHLVGDIPEGLELDHLCWQRVCVNPEHVRPMTHAENTKRRRLQPQPPACPSGHPYSDENTYLYTYRDGKKIRRCCVCTSQRAQRQRERLSQSGLKRRSYSKEEKRRLAAMSPEDAAAWKARHRS